MSGQVIWFLVFLPMLVLQWVAVIVLARAGRRSDWWCLLVGVSMNSLSRIQTILDLLGLRLGLPNVGGYGFAITALGVVGWFGSMLFMVGFCLHAFRSIRLVERVNELEAVAAAQAEELGRRPG